MNFVDLLFIAICNVENGMANAFLLEVCKDLQLDEIL